MTEGIFVALLGKIAAVYIPQSGLAADIPSLKDGAFRSGGRFLHFVRRKEPAEVPGSIAAQGLGNKPSHSPDLFCTVVDTWND